MIEVENLRKRFGRLTAVEDVSFQARDGVVTGLLGPNGAGKTTTLRVLYTLMTPDGGSARIDGIDVVQNAMEARKRVGVLPDARGLYPRLTAREHIRYFGGLHGLGTDALDRRTEELIELLEMRDIADRRTQGFSQGERMKVAIARALVHRPRNIILDEPTNGLDVMSTRALRVIIQRLRSEGCCVLFSSHVMQEVAALCDQVVVVARGRVVASGSADELKARTGRDTLEEAFVAVIGTDQGLAS